MDINQLLQGKKCTCGKEHTCPIEAVYIERGAAARLTELCRNEKNILLVADENTFAAAGEGVLSALEGKNIKKVIFSGKKILVPDEIAIKAVTDALSGSDMIVGIGSGVIQDLCKYVSFYEKVPYMIVATAPSMDGYASNGAAMITGGMKVTYSAGLPKAILADPAVLKEAPMEMLRAGYGDIIGKYSALNDWKISHVINGEYFCGWIYDITYDRIIETRALAEGIKKREEESIKTLMEALVVVGILMSFAGSSRPASGSEHHLSHFFEITGILSGTEYFPHGIDVAYSTVITAAVREKLLANPFPKSLCRPAEQEKEAALREIYRDVAQGCIDLQKKVGNYTAPRFAVYLEKEEEIRSILKEMPSPEAIEEMLSAVGLSMKEFYELYGEKHIKDAVLYAKDLKDRFTVLWLNYDFFGGM